MNLSNYNVVRGPTRGRGECLGVLYAPTFLPLCGPVYFLFFLFFNYYFFLIIFLLFIIIFLPYPYTKWYVQRFNGIPAIRFLHAIRLPLPLSLSKVLPGRHDREGGVHLHTTGAAQEPFARPSQERRPVAHQAAHQMAYQALSGRDCRTEDVASADGAERGDGQLRLGRTCAKPGPRATRRLSDPPCQPINVRPLKLELDRRVVNNSGWVPPIVEVSPLLLDEPRTTTGGGAEPTARTPPASIPSPPAERASSSPPRTVPDLDSDEDEEVCCICLEGYAAENPKYLGTCAHHFHYPCVLSWKQRSNRCPMCNGETLGEPVCAAQRKREMQTVDPQTSRNMREDERLARMLQRAFIAEEQLRRQQRRKKAKNAAANRNREPLRATQNQASGLEHSSDGLFMHRHVVSANTSPRVAHEPSPQPMRPMAHGPPQQQTGRVPRQQTSPTREVLLGSSSSSDSPPPLPQPRVRQNSKARHQHHRHHASPTGPKGKGDTCLGAAAHSFCVLSTIHRLPSGDTPLCRLSSGPAPSGVCWRTFGCPLSPLQHEHCPIVGIPNNQTENRRKNGNKNGWDMEYTLHLTLLRKALSLPTCSLPHFFVSLARRTALFPQSKGSRITIEVRCPEPCQWCPLSETETLQRQKTVSFTGSAHARLAEMSTTTTTIATAMHNGRQFTSHPFRPGTPHRTPNGPNAHKPMPPILSLSLSPFFPNLNRYVSKQRPSAVVDQAPLPSQNPNQYTFELQSSTLLYCYPSSLSNTRMTWCRTGARLAGRLSFHLRAVGFSPLPEKLATGGEDAYISTSSVQAVLDGVSWWRDNLSVDAGLYSAALAKHMYDYVEDDLMGDLPASSLRLLQRGYELSKHGKILGTTTALVATLQGENKRIQDRDEYVVPELAEIEEDPSIASSSAATVYPNNLLDVAYVGDCGLLVIRNGQILFASEEQQHDVDYPFQLGDGSPDTPRDGVRLLIPVRRGDIVLMGSDGIFDNVYTAKLCDLMWAALSDSPFFRALRGQGDASMHPGDALDATLTALNHGIEQVVAEALTVSQDIRADSPYATRCIENGANFEGGKPDDMTVLAAIIEDEDEARDGLERLSEGLFPPPYRDWP
eukprot:gene8689-6110_t